ncbi:DUF3097 family protein [Quadrisphaera sp. DSM 44207]|uniref:DUF3097 family protein n=1 Tax=Quadrisphaera sp. DSM 44207 TaxID=1881057 RepID=UPI001C40AD43
MRTPSPDPPREPRRAPGRSGWGGDVLASPHRRARPRSTDAPAEAGLVVEDVETGWCGAVVRVEKSGGVHVVVLEDRRGRTRTFPLGPGFLLDGAPVRLVPPAPPAPPARRAAGAPGRTASGSVAVTGQRARVARESRIWVEGRHDAELVEKIWGDDLRVEGVVVEGLDGVDHLAREVAAFQPGPGRRVGVLVDHLLDGTKEARLVQEALRALPAAAPHVLVVGHPYVDVWQAVRPHRLGLAQWPVVPRGRPWKEGVLEALRWPRATPADVARGWRRILAGVDTIADLEPALSGRVEQLIDFVTGDALDR